MAPWLRMVLHGTLLRFSTALQCFGGVPVDGPRSRRTGQGITATPSQLADLSADDAEAEKPRACPAVYMTQQDYFDLKSFSYYPRGYTADEFLADVAASDPARLPFRRSQSVFYSNIRC